ncbi:MAG: DUF1232 domain-containing protein [Pseudomonadales bacterium]|nr:DUF1232 domain-containing protein [Pseudomonadales bacterium]
MLEDDNHKPHDAEGFEKDFSDQGFWSKAKGFARTAGIEVMSKATLLFYAAKSDKTPLWAKTIIYGALGYFINSMDAIPDLTPVVGFADDLGVLVAAIAAVAAFISPESKRKAEIKIEQWFGSTNEQEEINRDD